MFIDLIRKIESYLNEISQYSNNECWECSQSEQIQAKEEYIKYELETYPEIVSDLFNDVLSAKCEMDDNEDGACFYDIQALIEELTCLIKEYECTSTISHNDEYWSDFDWNIPSFDELDYEYQECLDEYFVSESKSRLAADIKRASEIYAFIKENGGLVTREKILMEFPKTSVRALNKALSREDVLSYDSAYIVADNLRISEFAKRGMLFSLGKIASDCMQHNISELFNYTKIYNNDFLSDAKISTPHQLFSVVSFFFSKQFTFMRPYFARNGVKILSAEDQLKKYLTTSRNYSIRELLDYAKSKKITVDNIVRILTSFNDLYYILDKEYIIPKQDTGINEICRQQLVSHIV